MISVFIGAFVEVTSMSATVGGGAAGGAAFLQLVATRNRDDAQDNISARRTHGIAFLFDAIAFIR
jgi:uncharacterized membrane protein